VLQLFWGAPTLCAKNVLQVFWGAPTLCAKNVLQVVRALMRKISNGLFCRREGPSTRVGRVVILMDLEEKGGPMLCRPKPVQIKVTAAARTYERKTYAVVFVFVKKQKAL